MLRLQRLSRLRPSPSAGGTGWLLGHVRRAIFEARQQDPERVGTLLQLIGQLYRWEKELRNARAGPRPQAVIRAAHARPALN